MYFIITLAVADVLSLIPATIAQKTKVATLVFVVCMVGYCLLLH